MKLRVGDRVRLKKYGEVIRVDGDRVSVNWFNPKDVTGIDSLEKVKPRDGTAAFWIMIASTALALISVSIVLFRVFKVLI